MSFSNGAEADRFALALEQCDADRLQYAEALCRKELDSTPGHAGCHHLLGVIRYRLGFFDEAIDSIGRAVALDGELIEARNDLGHILTLCGRLDEARAQLETARALNPNYADAANNLGTLFKAQGQLEAAAKCYEEAISLQMNHAGACSNLGTVLLEQGRLIEAETMLRRALACRPESSATRAVLGSALAEQGKAEEAIAEFEQALVFNPGALRVWVILGVVQARRGRVDDAKRSFRICRSRDPEDRFGAGLQLAKLGEEPLPARAADAFIIRLYSVRTAATYRGAELVARMFDAVFAEERLPDVLDAGCGAGGVGRFISGRTARLDGVDLSPDMLKAAAATGIYARLFCQDLVAFMAGRPDSYDAVTCAATLIHFGDLTPVFRAVAGVLREGGAILFTVFPDDENEEGFEVKTDRFDQLVPEGCFIHGRRYLERIATSTGFQVLRLEREVLEYSSGMTRDVFGCAFVRRPEQANGRSA